MDVPEFEKFENGIINPIIIYTVEWIMVNAIGYYIWDIVKSAYKQIKEENENIQQGEIFHP